MADKLTYGGSWLYMGGSSVSFGEDPYNPLHLPPYTIRLKFTDSVTPSFRKGTGVQVTSSPNVWDLTYANADWSQMLLYQTALIEVLGANTSSVTNMSYMLYGCSSLTSVPLFNTGSVTLMTSMFDHCSSITSVPLFNTGSVTNMGSMLYGCSSLTSVPLFNTGSVANMSFMFYNCRNVASGSFALYQQASSQSAPPSSHSFCFTNCGVDTTTGAAELAQIPSGWK